MNQDKSRHSSGQVLIESLVAISVGVVGILGFLHLLTQSIGTAKDTDAEFTATYLAAEGIEVVKGIIDENAVSGDSWNAGISPGAYEVQYDSASLLPDGGRKLRFDTDSGLYSYDPAGAETTYRRRLTLSERDMSDPLDGYPDVVHVISDVTWTARGGGEKHVSLEDHFFDWRPALQ